MKKRILFLFAVLAVCFLSGCSFRTVDQMYCLPKRPDSYNNLQSVMDGAMVGHEYCAPLAGENRQSVQMADLDGDGVHEYLLFSKNSTEKSLQILIFRENEESFDLVDTISCAGTSFDVVEYVQMDTTAGLELVVGCQLNDQTVRSLTVYQYAGGMIQQLLVADYSKFLTCDIDTDGLLDLFVIRPGQSSVEKGVAEFYSLKHGSVQRSNEALMSVPAEKIRRIIVGQLQENVPAIFVGSTIGDASIITDVYAVSDGEFSNISLSTEYGASINTLRKYAVYAEDVDNDGLIELPSLISMTPIEPGTNEEQQHLIRWFSMDIEGNQIDKIYTYHNYVGNWYVQLNPQIASRICVRVVSNSFEFYLWDSAFTRPEMLFTINTLTGNNRREPLVSEDVFILHQSDTVTYTCQLHSKAKEMNISWEDMIRSFGLIRQNWKTGET